MIHEEEEKELTAAIKIQSLFRGQRSRKQHVHHKTDHKTTRRPNVKYHQLRRSSAAGRGASRHESSRDRSSGGRGNSHLTVEGIFERHEKLNQVKEKMAQSFSLYSTGYFIEIAWTALVGVYFTIEIEESSNGQDNKSSKTLIENERLLTMEYRNTLHPFLKPRREYTLCVRAACSVDDPSQLCVSRTLKTYAPSLRMTTSTTHMIELEWTPASSLQYHDVVYSIEMTTRQDKPDWLEVFSAKKCHSCRVCDLDPHTKYSFRCTIVECIPKVDRPDVDSTTSILNFFSLSSANDGFRHDWTSNVVSGITCPEQMIMRGLGCHWEYQYHPPLGCVVGKDVLCRGVLVSSSDTQERRRRVIEPDDPSSSTFVLTSDVLKPNQEYEWTLVIEYCQATTSVSNPRCFSTAIPTPEIKQCYLGETQVEWTPDPSWDDLPHSLSVQFDLKVMSSWKSLCQGSQGQFLVPMATFNIVYEVRLNVYQNEKTINSSSPSCFILSPLALQSVGFGTALHLSWSVPTNHYRLSSMEYQLTQQMVENTEAENETPSVIYQGNSLQHVYLNNLQPNARYYFTLTGTYNTSRGMTISSFGKTVVYSTKVEFITTVSSVSNDACTLACPLQTPLSMKQKKSMTLHYRVLRREGKDQEQLFYPVVESSDQNQWTFNHLTSSTFYHFQVQFRIVFQNRKMTALETSQSTEVWQIIADDVSFLTACKNIQISNVLGQPVTLSWKSPSTSVIDSTCDTLIIELDQNAVRQHQENTRIDDLSYSIEMYDPVQQSFVSQGISSSPSFEFSMSSSKPISKSGTIQVQPQTFYCVRINSLWKPSHAPSAHSAETLFLSAPESFKIILDHDASTNSSSNIFIEMRWKPICMTYLPEKYCISSQYGVYLNKLGTGQINLPLKEDTVDKMTWQCCYTSQNRTRFIARHLDAYATYWFRLQIQYSHDQMKEPTIVQSPITYVHTKKSVPGIVPDVKVVENHLPLPSRLLESSQDVTGSFFVIQWSAPRNNGSPVTGYALEMACRTLDDDDDRATHTHSKLSWTPNVEDWTGLYVGLALRYSVDTKALRQYGSSAQRFQFRIQAANEFGFGPYGPAIEMLYRPQTLTMHRTRTSLPSTGPSHNIVRKKTNHPSQVQQKSHAQRQFEAPPQWKISKFKQQHLIPAAGSKSFDKLPHLPTQQQQQTSSPAHAYLLSRSLDEMLQRLDPKELAFLKRPIKSQVEKDHSFSKNVAKAKNVYESSRRRSPTRSPSKLSRYLK